MRLPASPSPLRTLRIGATVHAGERGSPNFGPLYNRVAAGRSHHLAMEAAPRQIVAIGGGLVSLLGISSRRLAYHGFLREASAPGALSTRLAA